MTMIDLAHYGAEARSALAVDRRTARAIAALCVAVAAYGVAFGVLGRALGLPTWAVIGISLAVYAGGSQMALLGVLSAGGAPLAGAAGGLVLNTRLVAFGAAAAPLLRGRPAVRLVKAYLLTDEAATVAMVQPDPVSRQRVFWFSALALWSTWQLSTAVGALAGGGLADPAAVGLDAAFPAAFLVLIAPMLRSRAEWAAAVGGALGALVGIAVLPPGLPVLLAMATGVATALLMGRRTPRRCAA